MLGATSTTRQMALMALAYLRGRKLRTALTTLSIVFGVALIFAMNLALPGIMDAFKRTMTAASGAADLSVASVTGESFAADRPLATVAGVAEVVAVSGILRRQISLPPAKTGDQTLALPQIELVGVDPASIGKVRNVLVSDGRFLRPGDSGRAVVPAALSDLVPQFKVGVALPLITARGLKFYGIVGLMAAQPSLGAPQIVVTLADAQAAFNQPGLVNTLEVSVKAGADRETVAREIRDALGSGFDVNRSASQADAIGTLRIGFAVFNLMGFLTLFVGGFLIFNTFRTVVVERRRDFALLRAIGARRRHLVQAILVESLIQGAAGTAIGLILGWLLAMSLAGVMREMSRQFMPGLAVVLRLDLRALGIPVALGLLATLLASFLPARSAGRMSPVDGLRPQGISEAQRAARGARVAGSVLLVVAALMLGAGPRTTSAGALLFLAGLVVVAPALVEPTAYAFGPLLTMWFTREGELAQSNVVRQPGRAAITASTLMIGLAVLIMIAAVVHSLDTLVTRLATRSFSSDILVTPRTVGVYGNVIGADDRLAGRLRTVPGVQTVASLRYANSSVDGRGVQLFGIDAKDYPKVSIFEFARGSPQDAFAALDTGRTVLVNSLAAVALQLGQGDEVALETPDGLRTYRVVGVADELLGFKFRTLYTSQTNLKADFNKAEDVTLMIGLEPGADRAATFDAVERLLADYPQFTARMTGEFRKLLIDASVGGMRMMYGLAIVILIPAALGLLNTLTINVLERTREIGVVRAVGGSRRQVRRLVMVEALLLGALGACIGVVGGVVMSYGFTAAFATIGWTLPWEFPVAGVVMAALGAVVLALAASILPARSAAGLDIVRALQHE